MIDSKKGIPVKGSKRPNGTIEYHVTNVEGWDDFESLARFIVKEFSANLVDKLDGICSRTWEFEIDNRRFKLKHHDDIGNYFFSDGSVEGENLMKMIANELNNRLSTQ
jgi:hypothetical protein